MHVSSVLWEYKVRAVGTQKTREWKSRHQIAGVEIAGEGKVWKAKVLKNVFLTILTENRVIILTCLERPSITFILGNRTHMTEKQHTMR